MKLSDFDYDLPKRLIAQSPAHPRDHARLLVYDRASGKITDDHFYNLGRYLIPATTLVLNDSKVEKCRLRFGAVEIFVLNAADPYTVKALVRPGNKFKTGDLIELPLGGLTKLSVNVLSVSTDGSRILRLSRPLDDVRVVKHMLTPFPPYIKQDESLSDEYQTVYAEPLGSKAAPTAGLHFTKSQLKGLAASHDIVRLTLHVGLGTFATVKSQDLSQHRMHAEEYILTAASAEKLNQARHITAVGTTSARTLESLKRPFEESSGSTDIFITPGYRFQNVDALVTNFHLPKSTLLMLVAALTGLEELQRIYRHAVTEEYRFYSFGDAMLIL